MLEGFSVITKLWLAFGCGVVARDQAFRSFLLLLLLVGAKWEFEGSWALLISCDRPVYYFGLQLDDLVLSEVSHSHNLLRTTDFCANVVTFCRVFFCVLYLVLIFQRFSHLALMVSDLFLALNCTIRCDFQQLLEGRIVIELLLVHKICD